MDQKERELRLSLKNDFAFYAPRCLKILTKEGALKPSKEGAIKSFRFNTAQRYLHRKAEEQLARTGMVRIYVIKGRQQGVSTYIEGRFYWRVSNQYGVRAFILTHCQPATDNLFEMTGRYHEHCPAIVKPSTGGDSKETLFFNKLDSGYKIGTAGSKGTGRSSTIQFFHGSEVCWWPNAADHAAGVMQAIPRAPGTEVFMESTGNGLGNYGHQLWLAAEAGENDYLPVFIPWFWQEEYRQEAPEGFKLDEEEEQYRQLYDLTLEQMAWRRAKIAELGDIWLFRQEYPATAVEAFQSANFDAFIPGELVTRAQKTVTEAYGPKVLGVDVARFGDDRTAIVFRQGRTVHWVRPFSKLSTMATVGRVKLAIDEVNPNRVFIDVDGVGSGVYDRLLEMFPEELLIGVHGAGSPLDDQKHPNKRNENWHGLKEWLADGPVSLPPPPQEPAKGGSVELSLATDISALSYDYDSKGRQVVESKDKAKKRGVRSPDLGDALALTFAAPVAPKQPPPHVTYIPAADAVVGY